MDKLKALEEKTMAILALAENFERTITPSLLQIWLEALHDYTVGQVNAGVRKVISEYSYKTLPPFAVLKKAIDDASGIVSHDEAIRLMATAEWHAVLKTIHEIGRFADVTALLHPTTVFVLRCMGGWGIACQWLENELQWRQRDFISLWQQSFNRVIALSQGASGVEQMGTANHIESAAQRKILAITHGLTTKNQ